jgi:hypothetical protein
MTRPGDAYFVWITPQVLDHLSLDHLPVIKQDREIQAMNPEASGR